MGISAVYGTGVYNQSRYGVFHLSSDETLTTFSSSSSLKGFTGAKSSTQLQFSSLSNMGIGTTADTGIIFDGDGHILSGRAGSSQITFSSYADLTAEMSKIEGYTLFQFSNPSANLEGNGALEGADNILFTTQGHSTGKGEMVDRESIVFSQLRAMTNAKRIKATTPLFVIIKKSEIAYTNENPFYSTWNGKYVNLNANNNPNIGYLDLLYTETSGSSNIPYKETTQ